LNALLGENRAIVSDVHGTTRDTIEETLNIGGVLFRFIDTAGIRETDEVVEKIGIERTFMKISEASIVLAMLDLTRNEDENKAIIQEVFNKVDLESQSLIILLNKADVETINKNVNYKNIIVSLIENKEIGITIKTKPDSNINHSDNIYVNHNSSINIIKISAKTGLGINNLKEILAQSQKDILGSSEDTLVTNQRHAQALSEARTSLLRVREGLASGLPTDLAAQDIREAIYHIGSIVGEISTDEVLGNIFRNFCIGK
jgi:tRNA modification GTPase